MGSNSDTVQRESTINSLKAATERAVPPSELESAHEISTVDTRVHERLKEGPVSAPAVSHRHVGLSDNFYGSYEGFYYL